MGATFTLKQLLAFVNGNGATFTFAQLLAFVGTTSGMNEQEPGLLAGDQRNSTSVNVAPVWRRYPKGSFDGAVREEATR